MPMEGTGGLDCSVKGSELAGGAAGAAVAACCRKALDAPPLKPAGSPVYDQSCDVALRVVLVVADQ